MTQIIKRFTPKTIWKQMRHVRQFSSDASYRWFAQQLTTLSNDDLTGLTYLFEAQPYSLVQVLQGHILGIFATTVYREGYTRWYDPDPRAILPLQDFHVPQNMKSLMRKGRYQVRVDEDFRKIMEKCAEGRDVTHITPEHMDVYMELHRMGHAHCVGVWEDGELVGGRYGVAIGGYFTGESNFQQARDAGKVALVRSAEILAAGGFVLHDTRWPTEHMGQFGGKGISREEFHKLHAQAIMTPARFDADAPAVFTSS